MIFSSNIAVITRATALKKVFSCDLGWLLIFGRISYWRNRGFGYWLGHGESTIYCHWLKKEKELSISAFFGFYLAIICFLGLRGHEIEAHLGVELIFHFEFWSFQIQIPSPIL